MKTTFAVILAVCFFSLLPGTPIYGGPLEINQDVSALRRVAALVDGDIVSINLENKSGKYSEWSVVYLSDGLKVKGFLYTPREKKGKASKEKRAGIVFSHGGVDGVPGPLKTRCRQLAEKGYVVFAPSYRGEDGSEGEVEVAAGEVADVLNAARLLRNMKDVDKDRIGMIGASHGGIITLLAIERDQSIKAAVCAYGVSNTFTWYKYLVDNGFDVSDPLSLKVYGKGPDDRPEAFRKRAPALDAHLVKTPLLLLYGEKDSIVPASQGYEMKKALWEKNREYVKKNKVSYSVIKDVGHGFLFFMDPARRSKLEIKRSSEAWNMILDFLKKELSSGVGKTAKNK